MKGTVSRETGTLRGDGYRVRNIGGVVLYVHRLVAEEMLGRPLRSGEDVHHRNGNRADNRPENLEIADHREHGAMHFREWNARRAEHGTCVGCGSRLNELIESCRNCRKRHAARRRRGTSD